MQANMLNTIASYIQTHGTTLVTKTLLVVGISIVGYFFIKRIKTKVESRVQANSIQENIYIQKTSNLAGKFVAILLTIFLILAIFQVIGFDTAIIMGWISLSLWFVMETTIENMVAGIMILTNKKVRIGDFVQLLWGLNMRGTIEEITLRYTVVRTFDKKRTIIPNSILANTPIETYKSEPLIRGEILFTLPRHVHIPQVKKIMIDTINSQPKVLYKEYTNVWIESFDKRWIQIKSVFFGNPKSKSPFMIARDLKPLIAQNLKKYGIEIPYPHITLSTE